MREKTVRMLFIGNSFTKKNDLPGLLSMNAYTLRSRLLKSRKKLIN